MIIGIIQARMGSTRYPGKVLKKVNGKTMFEILVERMRSTNMLDDLVLATTTNDTDDILVDLANRIGIPVYRGSETDVLDRFVKTSEKFRADIIVRILNDCPLLDPFLVDEIVQYFVNNKLDFISNQNPHTYPDGMDISVFSKEALYRLDKVALLSSHREHIVPGFWEIPGFHWQNYYNKIDLFKHHRWTLDYPEDFEVISRIIEVLYKKDQIFHLQDILDFVSKHPEIEIYNKKYLLT